MDRVTPPEKKTLIQGVNVAIVESVGAIFSFVFGLTADSKGNSYTMWVGFWVSLAAALVNLPLVFDPELGQYIAQEEDNVSAEGSIDEDTIQNLLDEGEYVPIVQQYKINQARGARGEPFLKTKYGKYSQDDLDISSGNFLPMTLCICET